VGNVKIGQSKLGVGFIFSRTLKQKIIDEFARISPIAWAYIVFTGKYNFKKSDGSLDVDMMVDELEKHLKKYFWKKA
jgi:hypothetical protein